MRISRWRAARALAALTGGVLLALTLPGIASASVALPDGVVVFGGTGNDYTFATTTTYWSVIGVQPRTGDVDLVLYPVGGAALNSSTLGVARTDFVAINSNSGFRPLGELPRHRQSLLRLGSARGPAAAGARRHRAAAPGLERRHWCRGPGHCVRRALRRGRHLGGRHVPAGRPEVLGDHHRRRQQPLPAETNPASSSTFTRSRTQAGAAIHGVVDGCTLYTATYTGWHGLAVVDDRWPSSPGAGIAYALHQWNPAKPTTCPIKNFPDSTPA